MKSGGEKIEELGFLKEKKRKRAQEGKEGWKEERKNGTKNGRVDGS